MRNFALALAMFLPVGWAFAAESVSFGDGLLGVRFDGRTGLPSAFVVEGRTLVAFEARDGFSFGDWRPGRGKEPPEIRGCGWRKVSDDTACGSARYGDWKVDSYVQLLPERLAVRRWFDFEWCGATNRVTFRDFWVNWGWFACRGPKARYFFPGQFPPARFAPSGRAGLTRRAEWCGESPSVADDGAGWSVLAAVDILTDRSDFGNTAVREGADGILLSAYAAMRGYAWKGRPQRVGDFWLVFRRGNGEDLLAALQDWHRTVGHVAPADRPAWCREAILYSTHPCGRGLFDSGGFRHAEDYLPFVRALGVNTVWLRPVEHGGCYMPDDLFRLQPEVGTEDDHLRYVDRAHAGGMRVLRDAVMHGGRSDNARSRQHPEWLCRKEDGSPQATWWAYDFLWPTWIGYFADYVERTTRRFSLDGWRMDVPTGSRFPNWNPEIPYARASFAQNQGGLAQMRAIRAAARRANPDAATLAESSWSTSAAVADMIYDLPLCHRHFHRFNDRPADEVVADLRRWLDDQRKSFSPGTIWMRYPESHDSYPCDQVWGRAAANALMALCAWIEGVPMVMEESEDGAFETYRRILTVRRRLAELNDGVPDYLSVPAPPGVFACRRDNGRTASVFYVNFNGVRTAVGDLSLPPFGFAIRRERGPSAEDVLAALRKTPFAPVRSDGPAEPQAELRDLTNGVVTASFRIARVVRDGCVGFQVTDFAGLDPAKVRLVVRLPPVGRWFAHAAEGSFEGPYLVRHPNVDRYGRFGEAFDGAVVWDSSRHPLGFVRDHAVVGGVDGDRAFEVWGFSSGARVQLWDRLGREPQFAVSVSGTQPEDFRLFVASAPADRALAARDAGTGDPRLTAEMGGWRYETEKMVLRIRRTGSVAGLWRKNPQGGLTQVLGAFGVCGAKGTEVRDQAFSPFPRATFRKEPDGCLRLDFESGEIRGQEQNAAVLPQQVRARASYALGSSDDAFDLSVGFDFRGSFGTNDWELAIRTGLPAGAKAVRMENLCFQGLPPQRTDRTDGSVRFVYHAADGADLDVRSGVRRGLSLGIRLGSP